jgi:PhoH-like ATPase
MATRRKTIRNVKDNPEHAVAKSNLQGKGIPSKFVKPTIGGNPKAVTKVTPIKIIPEKSKLKKVFVLDTNVLIDDPQALLNFEKNYVVIPITVIRELDRNKGKLSMARVALRLIDELGINHKFINLPNGGQIKTELVTEDPNKLNDDIIIDVARDYQGKHLGEVTFVTNDRGASIKARALGINTESYKTNQVDILQFEKDTKKLKPVTIDAKLVYENGYVKPYIPEYWKIRNVRVNVAQEISIQHLFDPKITFLNLLGIAGTGKTIMAILAGLKMLDDGLYEKIIVTKPVVAVGGNDIGFLPGTKEEKMGHWIKPISDQVDNFLRCKGKKTGGTSDIKTKTKGSKRSTEIPETIAHNTFNFMVASGQIEVEAEAFIRGRSFEKTLVIIDEGQNFSAASMKVWMTRMGSGSKLVVTGDVSQIDVPYLSINNNALSCGAVSTHGQPWARTVFLDLGVRSVMSDWAANNL